MHPSRPSSEPATAAKVCDLIVLHHGAPSEQAAARKPQATVSRSRRAWAQEARRNHLSVRRRRIPFDRLSPDCFPVVLELSGSGQFVILSEKGEPTASGEDTYLVQFPDARESLVQAERLKSLYSGTCLLLQPAAQRPIAALWQRMKRHFAR